MAPHSRMFRGSNRSQMGSNVMTVQNQGGGNKKAGLGRPMAYTMANQIAFKNRGKGINNLSLLRITKNPGVVQSRPIGSTYSPNTYYVVPGTA